MPAHVCGVFSHKPSSDLVPQRGHSPPRSPALQTDLTNGLGVAGPMARSAADLALALDLLAGPDRDQSVAWRVTLPPARHVQLRSFRVLVIDDHPVLPVANDIRVALDQLADRLGKAGASVARSSKLLPDLAESAKLHTKMIRNFAAFGAPPEVIQKARENAATLAREDDSIRAQFVRAPLMSHHEWLMAEIGRARLRAQWQALFAEFDVVLCPPFAVPAFPHDHSEPRDNRSIDIDGKVHPYISLIVWGTPATPPGVAGNGGADRPLAVRRADHRSLPGRPDHDRVRRIAGAGVWRLCGAAGDGRITVQLRGVSPGCAVAMALRNTSKITAVDQPISSTPFSAVIGPSRFQRFNGVTSP
jgi:amidase